MSDEHETELMLEIEGLRVNLRDWFAGQALLGLMGAGPLMHKTILDHANAAKIDLLSALVQGAYQLADAMLAERGRAKP